MKFSRGVHAESIDDLDYRTERQDTVGAYPRHGCVHIYFHGGDYDIPLGVDISIAQAEWLSKGLLIAYRNAKQASSVD